MVRLSCILGALATSCLTVSVNGHPGEKHDKLALKREIEARHTMATAGKRALGKCADSLKHRQLMQRSVERRARSAKMLREKRGIEASKCNYCNQDVQCNN